jgi:uncharacterized OB-fold protein
LLTAPLDDLSGVSLLGSRCSTCGETSLRSNKVCPNCGKDTVSDLPLGQRATLWTYTIARHKPPGNYLGPDPFEPFGMGLVELPEGIRVLTPIDCSIDDLEIGMELEFRAFVRPGSSPEVVTFTFAPAGKGG